MPLYFIKPWWTDKEKLHRWKQQDAARTRKLRREFLALLEVRAQRTDLDPVQAARELEAWLEWRRIRPRDGWELSREHRDWR